MNELALFAGAGGGILGSHLIGNNIVCAVERDEFCRSVLIRRQNERLIDRFPIWDDVCTFDGNPWKGTVDLVSGGFPCQAFSFAARGRNVSSKNLWGEMLRIVGEVCPHVVFGENVSEKALLHAQKDLLGIGYKSEIIKLSARDVGAIHIRTRFWIFAYTNDHSELCRAEYAKAQRMPEFCDGVWQTIPDELRISDGMACRMDRLKAIGNGQVPLVAAVAFFKGYLQMMKGD